LLIASPMTRPPTGFGWLILAVGCAHQLDDAARRQPTKEQIGCYRVVLQRVLRTQFPIPTRLELRGNESRCDFAGNDFEAIADGDAQRRYVHGHWWLGDDKRVRIVWGGDFYGVAFDLVESGGQLRGTAVTFQDVGDDSDTVKAALVREVCSRSPDAERA
jgi:hypothetical protein